MAEARKLKSDGRYKDAPRFQVIYDYEASFRTDFKKLNGMMAKELIVKMATQLGVNKK